MAFNDADIAHHQDGDASPEGSTWLPALEEPPPRVAVRTAELGEYCQQIIGWPLDRGDQLLSQML